mmetsp:Transcript_23383/g.37434  ORF Transcript_23383/g.37434 Transcript_23383/m.37434 type:complete len:124 (-) Transcript_23383:197-568(-)|eukprot:CAMPEP_0202706724 /NCGR_PEP_ID=MMETSP1385-20130828/19101_1 /ASSEMBLY_ACC=CAM_ASM_000861 /TAXON_ID=933848 /ORGANISM="Elphidium margaritaceum" /LENGTH=123 /DNA_ID=CAMNT_0049365257 /DNA_START=87 /DNA_END=458 /DNA_ORIENTATION=+
MPVAISSADNFQDTIQNAQKDGKIIIAKFGAEWCAPCKKVSPFYHSLEGKYGDMVFVEIDYDQSDNEDIIDDYKVLKLPTFVAIKDGKEQERLQSSDEEQLKQFISRQFKDAVEFAFTTDADF